MTTTVSGKNQVTVPAALARELNIGPGTRLEWTKIEDGSMRVTPLASRAQLARRLAGIGKQWLRPNENPVGDLIDERQQDDRKDRLA